LALAGEECYAPASCNAARDCVPRAASRVVSSARLGRAALYGVGVGGRGDVGELATASAARYNSSVTRVSLSKSIFEMSSLTL
jgi:hypothetical protein